MNTREIAEEYRLSHWSNIIQERAASGKSIRSYCQDTGIRESVYYYWQKRLREAAIRELNTHPEESESTSLVPSGWAVCEPAPEPDDPAGSVTIEIGKCRVIATTTTDPDLLAKVCRTLMTQC